MSDHDSDNLNFITDGTLDRVLTRQRDHHVEVLREGLARKISHTHDDAEAALDYCRKLISEGADISEELKELECLGHSLALVVAMLRREQQPILAAAEWVTWENRQRP